MYWKNCEVDINEIERDRKNYVNVKYKNNLSLGWNNNWFFMNLNDLIKWFLLQAVKGEMTLEWKIDWIQIRIRFTFHACIFSIKDKALNYGSSIANKSKCFMQRYKNTRTVDLICEINLLLTSQNHSTNFPSCFSNIYYTNNLKSEF